MHPARPIVDAIPCPACGRDVDPLRAQEVVCFEDGFRYLCDAECRQRYVEGERSPAARTPRAMGIVSVPDLVREATLPRQQVSTHEAPSLGAKATFPKIGPGLGLAAAAVAMALPTFLASSFLSAFATVIVAGLALRVAAPTRGEIGIAAWIVGPVGVALAAIAALIARLESNTGWMGLAGAAFAGAVVLGRAWLDAQAREPIERNVRELAQSLPTTVRSVVDKGVVGVGYQEISTRAVKPGQEVMVLEGETLGVDGVVVSGEATAELFPSATLQRARGEGDPLLAGARIAEGALRILTTRAGEERSLCRPVAFGRASGYRAATIASLAEQITRLGAIVAVATAVLGLFVAGSTIVPLSAAAAVLIAAPLLAARRSAELPLIAAAAEGVRRGIVFHDAHTLESSGRVSTAAICAHGAATTGEREVVGVYPVADDSAEAILAIAAGVEAATEGPPIALAILRHAEARRVSPIAVRRVTELPGLGLRAIGPDGEPIVIGSRQLLLAEGVSIALADDRAAEAERRGRTALFVGVSGRVRGVIALQDSLRGGSRAAVQRLFDLRVESVLLSGDHRPTVEAIARDLDIANVRAELTPDEKAEEVRRLGEGGAVVAVIGHATEDDAALAAADVRLVLASAGAPSSEGTVQLATDDLREAAAAVWIAKATRSEAWRAVFVTLAGGGLVMLGATVGWVAPALAALTSLAVDAFAFGAGLRVMRRIALRVPISG